MALSSKIPLLVEEREAELFAVRYHTKNTFLDPILSCSCLVMVADIGIYLLKTGLEL